MSVRACAHLEASPREAASVGAKSTLCWAFGSLSSGLSSAAHGLHGTDRPPRLPEGLSELLGVDGNTVSGSPRVTWWTHAALCDHNRSGAGRDFC